MIHIKSLMAILLLVTMTFISCKSDEATITENLTAEWSSTAVKIDGVASPATTVMFLHLLSSKQYEITTSITPFTHPKTGVWSVNTGGDKLTLAGNVWTIHHLEGNTLRLENVVDGKELEIDFAK
ncbi:MAG: hypothetical protein H7X99_07935 [Saprospiraceae bacterium]|nr:hypothetical protein [Saprospiraceae bacterium]